MKIKDWLDEESSDELDLEVIEGIMG